jgi:hypothetical protein
MKKTYPVKKSLAAATLLAVALAGAGSAQAQSADALLDKLVEKGILSVKEANALKEQSDNDFTKAYSTKTGLPDWVTSMRLNGDLRLRYDQISSEDSASQDRQRFRYRLRFGFTAVLRDDFEVAFALTSGQNDPISNNQTLDDNGNKKPITIDKVYVKWNPIHDGDWNAGITLGKMENPLVSPSTILFDKDYTPEGAAIEASYKLNDQHTFRATAMGFLLDESGASSRDPMLLGGQLRWDAAWSSKFSSTLGGAILDIRKADALVTATVPDIGGGNTRLASTAPANQFRALYADAGVTYTFEKAPLYNGAFPITFSGDVLKNTGASANNDAWSAGVTIGKAGKKGLWELNYRYTRLEADAWYEELPESDFGAFYKVAPVGGATGYRSGTNIRGHWIKATYNVYDSMSLSVAYFLTDLINKPGAPYDSGTGRLFVEAVWKY